MSADAVLPSELPTDFAARRDDAHRLAFAVVAQARFDQTERFGLIATPGGFGTPRFGDDERQVSVAAGEMVIADAAGTRRAAITTLAAAAAFVETSPGVTAREHDSPELGDVHAALRIDAELTNALGAWFAVGTSALDAVADADEAADVSPVWLWPGHFDIAREIGDQEAGRRATYGASPGDQAHDGPYLYVGAWGDVDRSNPFWNDTNFSGASLPYAELVASDSPLDRATAFFHTALTTLTA